MRAPQCWSRYAPPALSDVPMVDIPLLPAQTEAAAIDQLEVAVLKRSDQFLHIGRIRFGQQIGLTEWHPNHWRL